MLTQEQLKEILHYDPETGVFTRLVNTGGSRKPVGTLRAHGYISIGILGKTYLAHRLAVFYMTGEWPPEVVDHINGTRGDNRWANLRQCSKAENAMNKVVRNDNKIGLKGVYKHRTNKFGPDLYRGQIKHGGEKYVEYFHSAEEADAWCRETRRRLHGEFASDGRHRFEDLVSHRYCSHHR